MPVALSLPFALKNLSPTLRRRIWLASLIQWAGPTWPSIIRPSKKKVHSNFKRSQIIIDIKCCFSYRFGENGKGRHHKASEWWRRGWFSLPHHVRQRLDGDGFNQRYCTMWAIVNPSSCDWFLIFSILFIIVLGEIGLVEMSLKHGIIRKYNQLIHPGVIPTGYRADIKINGEKYHGVFLNNPELVDDYKDSN